MCDVLCIVPPALTRFSIIGLPILAIQSGGVGSGAVTVSYKQCDAGTYAVGLACVACAVGTASETKEAQLCSVCLAGTYSGPAPSPQCLQCPEGTSTFGLSGESVCHNCTIG